jgi:L-ribulose-5-phosphate 4-epimerase
MKETGVIKFNCNWIHEAPLNSYLIEDLNAWRDKMFDLSFIGVNDEDIGYGNISRRFRNNEFIISGSATGKLLKLGSKHYTTVTEFDLEKNSLTAVGPILASSESLTHAVIYQCDETINGIIHIHHYELWKKLMNTIPTTRADVEYGTPAMANEMIRLFGETNLKSQKMLVMAGHQDGIISFGKDLNEAGNQLLNVYNAL